MTASFKFDARHGGRLASLRIGEWELLYGEPGMEPTAWGAYPMVPYAGRVDRGRFVFESESHLLEINHGEHAIHGTAFTAEWEELGPDHVVHELDDRWPLGGTVSHRGQLTGDQQRGSLVLELSVMATGHAMPAMVGWHPWFKRHLTPDGPAARLIIDDFDRGEMYEVGDDMIPTGRIISPPDPGPWDHPFRSLTQPLLLVWQDQLRLERIGHPRKFDVVGGNAGIVEELRQISPFTRRPVAGPRSIAAVGHPATSGFQIQEVVG